MAPHDDDDPMFDAARRGMLATTAGLALAACGPSARAAAPARRVVPPLGKRGDFDFLAGTWKIQHRRLVKGAWDEFEGEATCWTVLGGLGSIEELRIPARDFSGIGIRLLEEDKHVWMDFWVNGKNRVLTTPGTAGVFVDGVGTFDGDDELEGKPIVVRGVWDRITATSCRWYQAVSRDAGATWETNWTMDWTRA